MTNSNSKSVVNSVVEYIESLPEGSSTTTFKILGKLYGEESAWNMDPFSLHFEIYDEIERRGKVELDLSEYDGLIVGLPQNYTFVVRKRYRFMISYKEAREKVDERYTKVKRYKDA